MKIGFVTFEQMHGKKNIGSSRIRAKWVADNWNKAGPEMGTAEVFKLGVEYDVVIYQKAYFVLHAKNFKGIKILDLCDPDWRNWNCPIKEMLDNIDAVTCSSVEIAKFISGMTDKPVVYIPDRIDFSILPKPKEHVGELKSVAWYGYSQNFAMLDSAIIALKKRKLKLFVIADKTYIPSTTLEGIELINLPWSEQHVNNDLQKADLIINPQISKGNWKYKSNNKTTLAWALGMPVAGTDTELDLMVTEEARKKESSEKYVIAQTEYNVLKSVEDLKELISELQNNGKLQA